MNIGDTIELSKKTFTVEACKYCGKPVVNIDSDEIGLGDFVKLKFAGVLASNPETDEAVCIHCDVEKKPSRRKAMSDWFKSDSHSDHHYFKPSDRSYGSSSSGFNFGGGTFGGGGASGGF